MNDLVLFSYGLGADSTAILLRWLMEPETRICDLSDLVVVTAQTGDEWKLTGELVEKHIYPALTEYDIRTVQVARRSACQTDGIAVLADTREPKTCHVEGAYKLSDEMFEAGTIPTTGGKRLCSVKSKGWALDQFAAQVTEGRPYRHVVGFEADELSRVLRDQNEGSAARQPVYPLVEWGWDRAQCERYIFDLLGVEWPKSACSQCPYALTSKAGLARTLRRYVAHPEEAMKPLLMEWAAVCLNPRMGLIGGERLYDALASVEGGPALLERFDAFVAAQPHALYEVRRVFRPKGSDPSKSANAVRSVRRLAEGTHAEMLDQLHRAAGGHGVAVRHDDGIPRVWLQTKEAFYPCREHMLVAAPARAVDKDNKVFEAAWAAAGDGPAQQALFA
jgi:hypothetical protein